MVQADEDGGEMGQAMQLLLQMDESVCQVTKLVDNMLLQVKKGEMSTNKGLSFLEVKFHMLLNYLINLTYVVLRKSSGKKIEGDPSIDRLVEIRTVLEKMRPIDQRLKYQVDKWVKSTSSDAQSSTSFRPNPDNLMNKLKDSDESCGSEEDEEKAELLKGAYVPPKISAVYYDGDVNEQDKMAENKKKRLLNRSVIQELKEEFLETPSEVRHISVEKAILTRQNRDREEFEETFLTRLPRKKAERMTNIQNLGDELTDFKDWSSGKKAKKRKLTGKGKKKMKNKRKKFHR